MKCKHTMHIKYNERESVCSMHEEVSMGTKIEVTKQFKGAYKKAGRRRRAYDAQ